MAHRDDGKRTGRRLVHVADTPHLADVWLEWADRHHTVVRSSCTQLRDGRWQITAWTAPTDK